MVRPGDESPWAGGRGHLRAASADREQVIGTLKAAFVQGMLTKDEFDLRVSQALVPRTYAELASLTADLPADLAGAGVVRARKSEMRPSRLVAGATVMYACTWLYELFLSPHGGDNPTFPPLIIGGFGLYLLVLLMAAAMTADLRAKKAGTRPQ